MFLSGNILYMTTKSAQHRVDIKQMFIQLDSCLIIAIKIKIERRVKIKITINIRLRNKNQNIQMDITLFNSDHRV